MSLMPDLIRHLRKQLINPRRRLLLDNTEGLSGRSHTLEDGGKVARETKQEGLMQAMRELNYRSVIYELD